MKRFSESATELWDSLEKEMMEIVIQNMEKENLLHEIDNELENAESDLTELKDMEDIVLSAVVNDELTTSTVLFDSLMKKSAFECQPSKTEHADMKVKDITSDNVNNVSCTLTSSSKLVEIDQLEETMCDYIPNFTSTPFKVKQSICDQNGNTSYELREIAFNESINNVNLPQTESSQSNDDFMNDNDCCNLTITFENELCDINNGNNSTLKAKINESTIERNGNLKSDTDINIIDIKSKTGVCTNVKLDRTFKVNIVNDLCNQNNVFDVENNNLDIITKENINSNDNTINITVIENNHKQVSNQNDFIIANNTDQNKVSPSHEIKVTGPKDKCEIDLNKWDKVLETSIINTDETDKNCPKLIRSSNDFEFQQKIDNAEMHFNVSDLQINIPLDENEPEGTLKRPPRDEYCNENKKIKLDDQIENVNLDYDDSSFAQDVTVENFTRLIFESQKTIDENDPNWKNIHDMCTAEEYFKYVTYQWQSTDLPKPHTNLSKIFVPCPESLKFMQNPQINHAETEALIQQATKNIGEFNKLDKNKSEYILINKFYYKGNGDEQDVQYINKDQCEDLRIQEKILEFQQRFYK